MVVNIILNIYKKKRRDILSSLAKNTALMTVVNLLMRIISVSFNAYLTSVIGSSGMGLFQLIMTVYGLAVTLSCAGIRLSATRVITESSIGGKYDSKKTFNKCIEYVILFGIIASLILYFFSGFISDKFIGNINSVLPLKILSVSLPFAAINAAFSGYFTAKEQIPQYSVILLTEQISKIIIIIAILKSNPSFSSQNYPSVIVMGMTTAEIISFILAKTFKSIVSAKTTSLPSIKMKEIFRIAFPDASGTLFRSLLLTVEHLMIPKGFEKSGENYKVSLSAYGNIHGIALPVILFPCAVLNSLSALIIPELAKMKEYNNKELINSTVRRNLKLTLFYSVICSAVCFAAAPLLSNLIYKTNEAVQYIRILAPLVPVMYLDTVTDGMLKGLDKQFSSMIYNIIDSLICVILVYFLLPVYSVKGYIFILYISEIINFALSFSKLADTCEIRFRKESSKETPMFSERKQYSAFRRACEYQ